MPKKIRAGEVAQLNIRIRKDINDQLDHLFHDPRTGRAIYGAKVELTEFLFEEFLDSVRLGKNVIDLKPFYMKMRSWSG